MYPTDGILKTDHVEQRPCKVEWCKWKSKYIKNYKKILHKTLDFFADTYSVHKVKFDVFKKYHIYKANFPTFSIAIECKFYVFSAN